MANTGQALCWLVMSLVLLHSFLVLFGKVLVSNKRRVHGGEQEVIESLEMHWPRSRVDRHEQAIGA